MAPLCAIPAKPGATLESPMISVAHDGKTTSPNSTQRRNLTLISMAFLVTAGVLLFLKVKSEGLSSLVTLPAGRAALLLFPAVGIGGWVVCGISKNLVRYRVLVVMSLFLLVSLWIHLEARRPASEIVQDNREVERKAIATLTVIANEALDGKIPEIRPTGDQRVDNMITPFTYIVAQIEAFSLRMNEEIAAKHQENVFLPKTIEDANVISIEYKKAEEIRTIVDRYQKEMASLIKAWRTKYASNEAMDKQLTEYQQNADEGFALLDRLEIAKGSYLIFMISVFSEYRVEGTKMIFETQADVKRHDELIQNIMSVVEEMRRYQTRQLGVLKTKRDDIQKLSP